MFSFVFPMDDNRLEQFAVTKRLYDAMPQPKEFVIPTRTKPIVEKYLESHDLIKDVRLLPYTIESGFNPSKALNIGVRAAKYDQIVITSPEVMPETAVLDQLETLIGKNVVCQVYDQKEDKERGISLVNLHFRSATPAMYFLAMFNKKDIETINGWDEEFMKGYAYEDDDFGSRWVRAGLPFEIHEEIVGLHQWHPRGETIANGLSTNANRYQQNINQNIIRPEKGLVQ